MKYQNFYIFGTEEVVLMFSLLGIDGKVIKNPENFLKNFNDLTKSSSIAVLFIYLELPDDIINFLIEHKLENKRPFILLLPQFSELDIEEGDLIYRRIVNSINQIIR